MIWLQVIAFIILVALTVWSLILGRRRWRNAKEPRELCVAVSHILLSAYMIYCIGLKLWEWI